MKRAVPHGLLGAFRYVTQTFGVFLVLLFKGQLPPVFELRHIPLLMAVTISNSFYNLGLFASTGLLPLVDATGISSTACMVFVAAVHCVSKRSIELIKIIAILLAILGIFMMMQPVWIFGPGDNNNAPTEDCLQNDVTLNKSINSNTSIEVCLTRSEMELQRQIIGTLCSVLSGISIGIYLIILNALLGNLDVLHIALCTGAFGTIVCLITSLYIENISLTMNEDTWLLLIVHCVGASIDSVLAVIVVSLIWSLKGSIIFSLTVLISMSLQYSLMSSYIPGHRNWLEVMGAIVNCIGVLIPPAIDLIVLYKYLNPSLNDF